MKMPAKYIPFVPEFLGVNVIKDIPLSTLVPYIDWRFFFSAWRLTGSYDGIEKVCECPSCAAAWLHEFSAEDRPKAEAALRLYQDAMAMLRQIRDESSLKAQGIVAFFRALSRDEGIVFFTPAGSEVYIPTLRQQTPSNDGLYYSLSDFVSPENDYAGTFAVCVHGAEEMVRKFEHEHDSYNSILVKTLADRLAEAAAEWLHEQIRKQYWGYAADETLSIDDMMRVRYTGIRPAVGYPCLPDQSLIFDLETLLPFHEIGITLTENGAMLPGASVCGIVIAHPQSRYFAVGKIDSEQLNDYAFRRGKSPEEMRKWLINNI